MSPIHLDLSTPMRRPAINSTDYTAVRAEAALPTSVFPDVIPKNIIDDINALIDEEHALAGHDGPPGLVVSKKLADQIASKIRLLPAFKKVEHTARANVALLVETLAPRASFNAKPLHIVRCVDPRIARESHCRHFDSHLLTLLIPLRLAEPSRSNGDLIVYTRFRPVPTTVRNVATKIKHGIQRSLPLAMRQNLTARDLHAGHCVRVVCEPGNVYAFNGFVTKHGNLNIEDGQRRSLLVHWYDPGRSAGVSQAMRMVRTLCNKVRHRVT